MVLYSMVSKFDYELIARHGLTEVPQPPKGTETAAL